VAFRNVPWALDGATIPSSLARLGQYVATGGAEGIAQLGDLKVLPLSTPGNGVRILAGGGIMLNRYQGETPDQTYGIYANTETALGPSDMPPSVGTARSHLVCVTVGDPEFSQAGHPWMLGTDPPVGTEDTFQYVRPFVIQNVPSNTVNFDQLNLNYPALALARLDMPASTTTVQSSHIVDLRQMAKPREQIVQWHVNASVADSLAVATANVYEYWPDNSQRAVDIPKWATRCYATGFIEGFRIVGSCQAALMRIGAFGPGISSYPSRFDEVFSSPGNADRRGINLGGDMYIPSAYRGTTQNFQVQATVTNTSQNNKLNTDSGTSVSVMLRFVEQPD
jgi:hypothetical protein